MAGSSIGGSQHNLAQRDPYNQKDPYAGSTRSRNPSNQGSMRKGGFVPNHNDPSLQPFYEYETRTANYWAGRNPRCSQADDVEDFTHFQNFVDDDTPAPEASIPVPKVYKKSQNYIYQVLYALYCVALMAYIYVRITFTLDAPGLNRIYCTVVACLVIITCPSLLIQGLTLWEMDFST